ncbi:MAG: zf-HC2 domain-containing protein [Planctomycetota bacterium]|jgi:hypothetical protein
MNTHQQIKKLLIDFILGELPEQESTQVQEHLAECNACRNEVKQLEALNQCTTAIGKLSADQQTCESARQSLLAAVDGKQKPINGPRISPIWRNIMKSRISKFAAAAAIVLAVIIGMNLLTTSPNGTSKAWAIEQTIEALENINSLYMSGVIRDKHALEGDFETWARPHSKHKYSGDVRLETKNGAIVVASEQKNITYLYDPDQNIVSVKKGSGAIISPWLGKEFFEFMKKHMVDWKETYDKDPETGNDCVFVTCRDNNPNRDPKSWWFQFDLETKLPVSFKQWMNYKSEGQPQFYAKKLVYNIELPEGIFEFKIPEGAKVVDYKKEK